MVAVRDIMSILQNIFDYSIGLSMMHSEGTEGPCALALMCRDLGVDLGRLPLGGAIVHAFPRLRPYRDPISDIAAFHDAYLGQQIANSGIAWLETRGLNLEILGFGEQAVSERVRISRHVLQDFLGLSAGPGELAVQLNAGKVLGRIALAKSPAWPERFPLLLRALEEALENLPEVDEVEHAVSP